MSILRIYDPSECSADGIPLDWERCRSCLGTGAQEGAARLSGVVPISNVVCPACDGHGSLKAAALAEVGLPSFRGEGILCSQPGCGRRPGHDDECLSLLEHGPLGTFGTGPVIRCESCSHPMSEGTWESRLPADDLGGETAIFERMRELLARGDEPAGGPFHYSACDKGCDHGGPLRCDSPSDLTAKWDTVLPVADADVLRSVLAAGINVEASWRPVDIRTLGWPHDLRPEKLAVLCLRCFADRSAT